MSPDHVPLGVHAYPALAAALDRHLTWARDFASAGDLESAVDALRDAQSTFAELFTDDPGDAVTDRRFVTMAVMAYQVIISELQAITDEASQARAAGASESELLGAYEAVRARATVLALGHGLATAEQLADQFPSVQALREIARLDVAFGADASPTPPAGRGISARVEDALIEVEGWATGARLAYETLETERTD